ncbi:MoaD/ThiS family protein [Williamsia deligens]|uniref:Molybdopterin synthase sulfur carrier subunit n=1 Tax=Williamsia deligens TaxID=321325 RepID=A0ABW3G7D9_9NOCA|nr:MoaD/ThiS family protein [Williamsia deligens]MCP2192841.1 Molybdopterin converting factor, small subunit [Williamsia deligens]
MTAGTDAHDVRVEVRYFAAAEAAAGRAGETVVLPSSATLADLRAQLGADNPALARVLTRCSFLRDAVVVRDHDTPLAGATVIEVLPPFAGG